MIDATIVPHHEIAQGPFVTPNLSDRGSVFNGIDLASSTFLYGKSITAFKLPTRPRTGEHGTRLQLGLG
jgi:hypothetical protein